MRIVSRGAVLFGLLVALVPQSPNPEPLSNHLNPLQIALTAPLPPPRDAASRKNVPMGNRLPPWLRRATPALRG
jgi:hypothetical protein